MHPNTFLAADVSGPDIDKFRTLLTTEDDEVEFIVGEIAYQGSSGDDDQHYYDGVEEIIRLYNYITYGYGEIVSISQVLYMSNTLWQTLDTFIAQNNLDVTFTLVIGATYW